MESLKLNSAIFLIMTNFFPPNSIRDFTFARVPELIYPCAGEETKEKGTKHYALRLRIFPSFRIVEFTSTRLTPSQIHPPSSFLFRDGVVDISRSAMTSAAARERETLRTYFWNLFTLLRVLFIQQFFSF